MVEVYCGNAGFIVISRYLVIFLIRSSQKKANPLLFCNIARIYCMCPTTLPVDLQSKIECIAIWIEINLESYPYTVFMIVFWSIRLHRFKWHSIYHDDLWRVPDAPTCSPNSSYCSLDGMNRHSCVELCTVSKYRQYWNYEFRNKSGLINLFYGALISKCYLTECSGFEPKFLLKRIEWYTHHFV